MNISFVAFDDNNDTPFGLISDITVQTKFFSMALSEIPVTDTLNKSAYMNFSSFHYFLLYRFLSKENKNKVNNFKIQQLINNLSDNYENKLLILSEYCEKNI